MNDNLTFKVKFSSILILCFIFISLIGILTYNKFTGIITNISEETRPDIRVTTLRSLLNDIQSAEANVNSFSLTQDSIYYQKYIKAKQATREKITLIHELAIKDESFQQKFFGVDSLTQAKIELLEKLIILKQQNRGQKALDQLLNNLEISLTKDEKIKNEERKSILQWIRGEKNKKNHPIESINEEIQLAKRQEKKKKRRQVKQEMTLIELDKIITEKLNKLINELEIEETAKIKFEVKKAENEVQQLKIQIALFCLAIAIMLFAMVYVTISYLKNSAKARNALKEAKKEAEQLAAAKERFLANMSHELRTPMNAIIGFTEQLHQHPLNAEQDEMIQMIQKSSDHLLYIINDILDLTKLQQKKLQLEKIPFDFKKMIVDVIKIVNPLLKNTTLELKNKIDDSNTPQYVVGDQYRLQQILLNLLSNAIKFTPSGYVEIKTRTIEKKDDVATIEIEINDTGIGMNKEQLSKIFNEFEQGEAGTTREYGGTGLGLSISKMLVDLFGGQLKISSQPHKGTQAKFSLPLPIGKAEDIPEQKKEVIATHDLSTLKVLIVDDEDYNRKLLASILKKNGIKFLEVTNGKEAVDATKEDNFDLILMDNRMPIMNGLEATKEIKKLNQNTAIIALTAAVTEKDKQDYKDVRVNGVLEKPFKESELLSQIYKLGIPEGVKKTQAKIKKTKSKDQGTATTLDFSELESMLNRDKKTYIQMLNMFKESTQKGVKTIDKAFKKKDWQTIENTAHKIVAPCRHLSANDVGDLLKSLESSCSAEKISKIELEKISKIITVLKDKTKEVVAAVDHELININSTES